MLTLRGGLFLWVATAIFMNSHGALITCEAGTYVLGQSASVTCNFRTDVSASKSSFNMARYSSDAQKGDIGNDILVCHWLEVSQKHDCTQTEGYKFKNINQQYVTVEIPKVTDEYAGLYTCFFVPSQGKDTHACQLFVRKKTLNDTTPIFQAGTTVPQGGEDHTFNPTGIAVIGVSAVVGIMLVCIIAFIVWRRRQKNVDRCWATCLGRNRDDGEPEETVTFILSQDKQINQRLEKFKLSTKTLKLMMNILDQEMKKGLNESTRAQADVKMYPVYCPMPDKLGTGDYLMVDFGSTHVKVSDVKLRNNGVMIHSDSYPLEPDMKNATGQELFDVILSAISRSVKDQNKSAKQLKSVLVVHFPCDHKNIDKASIAKWTKEFSCEGVVDQDLNQLLEKSIRRKTLDLKLKVVAIVNSTVNTLISAVCHDPRCMISLVVGNGFNACYVDKYQKEDTDGAEGKGSYEIYNTELGALGENGSLDFLRTAYDKELDHTSSKNPGSQILEKMASWTYIGEIVRLALKDLRKDERVLTDTPEIAGLFKEGVFTANHVAQIDKDMSEHSRETADILRNLGVWNSTEEDLKTVKYICRLVTERAASLAAASLATLINRLNQPEIVIVVDGELYRQIPRFQDVMYSRTQELVKPALMDKFYLVASFRGGRTGAVHMAAAALSKQNAAAADT